MTEAAAQEVDMLSKEEASLYDRQIRLWGLDAQKRLRASRVLVCGLGGLGAEVAKNICLAGIKTLYLLDDALVTEEESCCQFFVSRADKGKNLAECSAAAVQRLNPMVDVRSEAGHVANKEDEFFADFDVVCLTNCCWQQVQRINRVCRSKDIKFYSGDVFGFFGFMFTDLGEHEYAEDVERPVSCPGEAGAEGEPQVKKSKVQMETVTLRKSSEFCTFENALKQRWSGYTKRKLARIPSAYFVMRVVQRFREKENRRPRAECAEKDAASLLQLRDLEMNELGLETALLADSFATHCMGELSPVAAIVGGVLGQEIIKAVSQKDEPHNNFFFYNGLDGSGVVDRLGYEV